MSPPGLQVPLSPSGEPGGSEGCGLLPASPLPPARRSPRRCWALPRCPRGSALPRPRHPAELGAAPVPGARGSRSCGRCGFGAIFPGNEIETSRGAGRQESGGGSAQGRVPLPPPRTMSPPHPGAPAPPREKVWLPPLPLGRAGPLPAPSSAVGSNRVPRLPASLWAPPCPRSRPAARCRGDRPGGARRRLPRPRAGNSSRARFSLPPLSDRLRPRPGPAPPRVHRRRAPAGGGGEGAASAGTR